MSTEFEILNAYAFISALYESVFDFSDNGGVRPDPAYPLIAVTEAGINIQYLRYLELSPHRPTAIRTSTVTQTPPSASSSITRSSSSLTSCANIGIGVGIPLSIISVLILVLLNLRYRRYKLCSRWGHEKYLAGEPVYRNSDNKPEIWGQDLKKSVILQNESPEPKDNSPAETPETDGKAVLPYPRELQGLQAASRLEVG
ncbi:hypothetical protein MMC21_004391 [Puttea exsequens]|nr:hypothetical protein [Puttea exsequens]